MRQAPYPKPGEILIEEFLKPMGISAYRLAKEIAVPQMRISEIVAGKRAITVDTGLRLSRYFGLNPDGHFKFPRLWSPKFPQAGRFNYGVLAASRVSLAAASFSR